MKSNTFLSPALSKYLTWTSKYWFSWFYNQSLIYICRVSFGF